MRIFFPDLGVCDLRMLFFDWVLKAIVIAILGLLELLGWKRAGRWLDRLMEEVEKDEKPVV